jgi:hypothetical protein
MNNLESHERAGLAASVYRELHFIVGASEWTADLMRAVLTTDPHGSFVNWRSDAPQGAPPATVMNVLRTKFRAEHSLWRFIIMDHDRLCGERPPRSAPYTFSQLLRCDRLYGHDGDYHVCSTVGFQWLRTRAGLQAMLDKAADAHVEAAEAWETMQLGYCLHGCSECQRNIHEAETATGRANDATTAAPPNAIAFGATAAAVLAAATRNPTEAASAHRRAAQAYKMKVAL